MPHFNFHYIFPQLQDLPSILKYVILHIYYNEQNLNKIWNKCLVYVRPERPYCSVMISIANLIFQVYLSRTDI